MPVWDEQVARTEWKGQSCLKPLRQKPSKTNGPSLPLSSNSTQFIQNCLRCVRCVRPWFVTCVVPEKPRPVSIPKLKVGDCPILHNCTFYQANYAPWKHRSLATMVVYHLANTGSHELQKPPKATYVTPYPPKKTSIHSLGFSAFDSLRFLDS
jgi:hypothetical protein